MNRSTNALAIVPKKRPAEPSRVKPGDREIELKKTLGCLAQGEKFLTQGDIDRLSPDHERPKRNFGLLRYYHGRSDRRSHELSTEPAKSLTAQDWLVEK